MVVVICSKMLQSHIVCWKMELPIIGVMGVKLNVLTMLKTTMCVSDVMSLEAKMLYG